MGAGVGLDATGERSAGITNLVKKLTLPDNQAVLLFVLGMMREIAPEINTSTPEGLREAATLCYDRQRNPDILQELKVKAETARTLEGISVQILKDTAELKSEILPLFQHLLNRSMEGTNVEANAAATELARCPIMRSEDGKSVIVTGHHFVSRDLVNGKDVLVNKEEGFDAVTRLSATLRTAGLEFDSKPSGSNYPDSVQSSKSLRLEIPLTTIERLQEMFADVVIAPSVVVGDIAPASRVVDPTVMQK